jgi:hypothetical protein
MKLLGMLAALCAASCAHPITATGVKECWTTWYVIGVYHGCAEGPSWQQHIEAPNGVREVRSDIGSTEDPALALARPGFFCFLSSTDELIAGCSRSRLQCTAERGHAAEDLSNVPECQHVDKAFCFGDVCMPTPPGCSERRSQASTQNPPTCSEQR